VLTAVKTDPVGATQRHQHADDRRRHGGLHPRTQARQDRPILADTAELFFEDVRVPKENLVGELNRGFLPPSLELPSERVGVACYALPAARRALDLTKAYALERTAFGQPIGTFQVNRHFLAEMQTQARRRADVLDQCVLSVNDGTLSDQDAAGLKWWTSEVQWEIIDRCLQ